MHYILLTVGLGLIILGANWLVDGATAIARKSGVSEFVIGLAIVGFGTSTPELVVSLTGALQGNSDIAVGNVFGSNIFNGLFILGLTAMITPIHMTRQNRTRDIPLLLGVTVVALLSGMCGPLLSIGRGNLLTRMDGVLFLLGFAVYVYYCFKTESRTKTVAKDGTVHKMPKAILLTVIGLAALIAGGSMFVSSATCTAHCLGVSDKFIATTVLAGGTSIPELATSITAAAKKRSQLAIGNILGSNIFNILLILGMSALVEPLSFRGIDLIDATALIFSALLPLIWAFAGRKHRIGKFKGLVMLLCFGAYYFYLFTRIDHPQCCGF